MIRAGIEDPVGKQPQKGKRHHAHAWHLLLLLVLFVLEFELLEIWLRSYYISASANMSVWAPFKPLKHFFFSFFVLFPAALLLITWPRCRSHAIALRRTAAAREWKPLLIVQLATYIALVLVTFSLSAHPVIFAGFTTAGIVLWASLVLITALSSLLTLAPWSVWRKLFHLERTPIALAALIAVVVTALALWLQNFTSKLAIGTLHGARALLNLFHEAVIFDIDKRLLGTGDFVVRISDDCAGYEGIALIVVFIAVYLWLFRERFRFPVALLAIPVGCIVVWLFNLVRIAALIGIGDGLSPAVALAGFHSNAGWIAFLAVSLGLLWMLHNVPIFERRSARPPFIATLFQGGAKSSTVDALLAPFVVLLAATLILGALTADFDILYPLKVISSGFALWHFRHIYDFSRYKISLEAVAVGVLVFFIWIVLVPAEPEFSKVYAVRFSEWPLFTTVVWIAFRLAGSIVVVPLAEELAFRGYLLARLSGNAPSIKSTLTFNLLAFSLSSILFGLMHGNWIAGTIAGMAYALARYRRGKLGDAVVAHGTTNLLLSFYVLLTGQWSYW